MQKNSAFGVPGQVRTAGLSLRRRSLYPAELRRHMQKIFDFIHFWIGTICRLGGGRSIQLRGQGTGKKFRFHFIGMIHSAQNRRAAARGAPRAASGNFYYKGRRRKKQEPKRKRTCERRSAPAQRKTFPHKEKRSKSKGKSPIGFTRAL